MSSLSFRLNGEVVDRDVPAEALLLDVIRELGLTGTKEGCGVGVCGLCSVMVNDLPISSCCYLAHMADGADVWTIEGIVERDPWLFETFVDHEGMQCGICTPGQVVSAYSLGLECERATEAEVRSYMAGNLCRCTGYESIVEAVMAYVNRT